MNVAKLPPRRRDAAVFGIAAIFGMAALGALAVVAAGREPVRIPSTDWNIRQVRSYVEADPVPAYRHASEEAFEAFRDLKFGIRVHWGPYSIWARDGDASVSLAKYSDEDKQRYQQLYKTWNPQGFDAEAWMRFFDRSGVKLFAFTTKHHDGFSMFDTRTRVRQRANWTAPGGPQLEACDTAYSIMDTPFHRDVVRELCDAARRHGIKIDLYFSHPDWYDSDFRDICGSPQGRFGKASAAERGRMMLRHRRQLAELLTNYGKIDMLGLDMFLDRTAWPALRETMLSLRPLQPDVMFRARGIGNYGDYYTPEGFVPGAKENTTMPWMVIYPLGDGFSFHPGDHFKGARWIIVNLVDAVAKGGNFMPAIGPDGGVAAGAKSAVPRGVGVSDSRRGGRRALKGEHPPPGAAKNLVRAPRRPAVSPASQSNAACACSTA
jgi:alpha-L-fucosidase